MDSGNENGAFLGMLLH